MRYFPDFSRPEVFERERTCKEVENCHRPTLTGSFLSKIPPVEVVGNRLFPQLRSDPFLCQSEIRTSATVFSAINVILLKVTKINKEDSYKMANMEPPPPSSVDLYTQQSFEVPKHPKYPPVSLFNNNLPMTYSSSTLRLVFINENHVYQQHRVYCVKM